METWGEKYKRTLQEGEAVKPLELILKERIRMELCDSIMVPTLTNGSQI